MKYSKTNHYYLPKGYDHATKNKHPCILFYIKGGVNGGFDNIETTLTKMILDKVVPGGEDFPFIVNTRVDKRNGSTT